MKTNGMWFFLHFLMACWSFTLSGQTRYAKIIDFDGVPQGVRQIVPYGDEYFVSYYQVCINRAGNLLEECGGLLKIDDLATIADSNLIREFSVSFNSILLDKKNVKLFFCGEPEIDNNYAHEFLLGEVNLEDLTENSFIAFKIPDEKLINYFQTNTAYYNNNILIGGSARKIEPDTINTIIISISEDKILDTFKVFNLGLNSNSVTSYVDNENRFSIHLKSEIGIVKYSHIVKFDTLFQKVWQWTSEVTNHQQLPYGSELKDGKTLICMHTPGFSNIGSIWAINEDKSVAWKFEFPDKNGGQKREIRRLKQLKNGDILGVGLYGDTRNDNPDFLEIPFMFRLTDKGQLLWLKAFYRDVYLSENVLINGHFLDATELENGDILAVGQIGNYLTFDPIIGGPRPDNDILIVRTDANGCINDACQKVTKLEDVISTTTNHPIQLPVSYLFPNPSGGQTDVFNPEQVLFIVFYDMAGTKVYETYDITNGIQTEGFHGVYLAHIHIKSGEVVRQKVVFY